MYRIYSKHTNRFIFPNVTGETFEECKENFKSRLLTITFSRVSDDQELMYGFASPTKVKDVVRKMSFEEMMDYCDFEIKEKL